MRISRCRTPGNGDETGRSAAKGRSCRACGEEEDGLQRASDGLAFACGVVDTLAMADEAAASGRRPGAAAVRPSRASPAREQVLAYGAEQAHASVRRDVLVQPEEVRRIVGALERLQPLVLLCTVCLADPLLALIHEEVHVDAGVVG